MLARSLRQRFLLSASASTKPALCPVATIGTRNVSSAVFRRAETHLPKFSASYRTSSMSEPSFREVTFVLRDGTRKTVQGEDGANLLEVAHSNGIEMEGACEASCACSTCHVILDADTFARLPEASEAEEDLLDLAPGLEQTSRLGCQIILNEDTENGVYHLPKMTLNFYVDGHVPEAH